MTPSREVGDGRRRFAVRTGAWYRGLPVTVLGTADGPAIAIAGYGTPLELALGVVSAGVGESLADVVAELVDARERRERGG